MYNNLNNSEENINPDGTVTNTSNINTKISNPASKFSRFCYEWSESIVQVFIIAVLLMTFLFRFFTVDGESMMNTLLNGDKVAVVRWNYEPTAGDVVVIKHGKEFDKPLIKRVIATQGQSLKIDFTEGTVFVNNNQLDESYIKEKMWLRGDNTIPSVIPDGYCFVMGDNRNNSGDSRHKMVGLIPNEDIIGQAKFIIYPFNRLGIIKSYRQNYK